jgi:nucleotide-binding universal stress UspA family protein
LPGVGITSGNGLILIYRLQPIGVVSEKSVQGFGKVLVAFDGSDDSVRAVEMGCSVAMKYGSGLIVAHVYSTAPPPYTGIAPMPMPEMEGAALASKETAKATLSRGLDLARTRLPSARGELLTGGSTVQTIVEYADSEKVDLIVVGTRGMTGLKKLIMGSVSTGLVSHSHCPVLVVR